MFQIVAGVQRLTVIHSFMKNEFKLKNLVKKEKVRKEDSLDSIFVRRIQQAQLSINVIDPQTPGKVKCDIFKRINQGER